MVENVNSFPTCLNGLYDMLNLACLLYGAFL